MDLSKHLEKAHDAIARRNYKLAASICGQLLRLQPDHGEARSTLRTALFKQAQAKPPSKLFAVLGGGVHRLSAAVSAALGKHARAAEAAERYLALDPLNESANLALGEALDRAGYRSSALAVYRAYAEARPRCLPACRRAGALLYEAGELDAALEMYEKALAVDPRDQESLKARKNLAAEGALRSTGIEAARSSRELIKDKAAHRELEKAGRLQLSAEEIRSELADIEAKLAAEPDNLALLARIADLCAMDGDLKGALDYLEHAAQLAPDRLDLAERAGDLRLRVQEQRIEAAERNGDAVAAAQCRAVLGQMKVTELRRRVAERPTDFGLRYDLGAVLLETDVTDEAIAELQQAVKDPSRKADALWLLGRAFRRKQLPELALGQLEKALSAAGGSSERSKQIIYEMGRVAEELGRVDAALDHYSRILEQDIGYRDVAQKVEQLKSSKSP